MTRRRCCRHHQRHVAIASRKFALHSTSQNLSHSRAARRCFVCLLLEPQPDVTLHYVLPQDGVGFLFFVYVNASFVFVFTKSVLARTLQATGYNNTNNAARISNVISSLLCTIYLRRESWRIYKLLSNTVFNHIYYIYINYFKVFIIIG